MIPLIGSFIINSSITGHYIHANMSLNEFETVCKAAHKVLLGHSDMGTRVQRNKMKDWFSEIIKNKERK